VISGLMTSIEVLEEKSLRNFVESLKEQAPLRVFEGRLIFFIIQ